MKASVYSLEGKIVRQIDLPGLFEAPHRSDLVKRAVLSEESLIYQPKGNYKFAGLETSARYRGRKEDFGAVKNKGIAHLPHEVLPKGQLGKVKRVPQAVHGRRAHPPKPQKKIVELINKKEYARALASALAMSADRELVCKRSSKDIGVSIPLIMDDSFERIAKSREVIKVLGSLNLLSMVEKAKKTGAKAPLIIVSGGAILKAARNLPGVDVVSVEDLKVRHLAPGTHAGRLTIFSESALPGIEKRVAV